MSKDHEKNKRLHETIAGLTKGYCDRHSWLHEKDYAPTPPCVNWRQALAAATAERTPELDDPKTWEGLTDEFPLQGKGAGKRNASTASPTETPADLTPPLTPCGHCPSPVSGAGQQERQLTRKQVELALDKAIGAVIDPVPDCVPKSIVRDIQMNKLTDELNAVLKENK